MYARVKVSAANYKATEKTPAFDIEGAAGDYAAEVEEKAKAAAKRPPSVNVRPQASVSKKVSPALCGTFFYRDLLV